MTSPCVTFCCAVLVSLNVNIPVLSLCSVHWCSYLRVREVLVLQVGFELLFTPTPLKSDKSILVKQFYRQHFSS